MEDNRLLTRGNKILGDLFGKSVHSIRQLTNNESSAKGFYRFLQNDRVSEEAIISNMLINCQAACQGKYVVCLQDTTEINLSSHQKRIKRDSHIGTTNVNRDKGLGFFLHPSLVIDAFTGVPYGYSEVKVWNRPLILSTKFERNYSSLPTTDKESYRWIEVSRNTKESLKSIVEGLVIIQDREGDIYEQFATIPDESTDLLVRARTNRTLGDGTKMFTCLSDMESMGSYKLQIEGKLSRKKREASIEVRYKQIEISKTKATTKGVAARTTLYLIEAKEIGYSGKDGICWRLLTSIPVASIEMAMTCIEWYSWRWTIEEVFKKKKKEGYNIEASELEYASSVRKMCLMIMEVTIKLFLMRLAYAEPEEELNAGSCFSEQEQEFLEHQIRALEGKTEKQKNPYQQKDLKRYVWAIARMGGWKGYESKRHPGITTLWTGIKFFKAAITGWELARNVSTR